MRDERDAEDAVQDAFLRAFERIKRFRGDASFDTWFTAVVVNVCRDRLRRRRVRQALPLEWLRGKLRSGDDVVETVSRRLERQALSVAALPRWHSSTTIRSKKSGLNSLKASLSSL